MRERRIPMHERSVRNIRADRKDQTRRIMKPQPEGAKLTGYGCQGGKGFGWFFDNGASFLPATKCPYGQPGDVLLIAEAWRTEARFDHLKPSELPKTARIHYEADGDAPEWAGRYRNQRFMCNWMVRIRRRLTDVRAERVQDISDADIVAEGVPDVIEKDGKPFAINARPHFAQLWDDTNGPGAWDRNDWVWALTFEKETQ